VPHTEVGRLTVNGSRRRFPRIVREGDVIEVFPYADAEAAEDEMPRSSRTRISGGLARMLRMLGFDTLYDNGAADREIVEVAAREHRIVLTRDRELLKCREIARGSFVHPLKPEAQLQAVAVRYALERSMRPFTLCLHCNLRLVSIEKARRRHEFRSGLPSNTIGSCAARAASESYWRGRTGRACTRCCALRSHRRLVRCEHVSKVRSAADFEHGVDHHRHVGAQAARAHHGAHVLARIAERRDHQVGTAVQHLREIEEIGRRADVSANAHTARDTRPIAIACGFDLREQIQPAQLCARPAHPAAKRHRRRGRRTRICRCGSAPDRR
jgi:uncharacterized protein with PIN domain